MLLLGTMDFLQNESYVPSSVTVALRVWISRELITGFMS